MKASKAHESVVRDRLQVVVLYNMSATDRSSSAAEAPSHVAMIESFLPNMYRPILCLWLVLALHESPGRSGGAFRGSR